MITNLRRLAALGPVLLALTAAPGCVTTPNVTIHHAEVQGIGPYGLGTMIYLQVRNDNAYDVQIRAVHARVTLGGRYPLGPIDVAPNQWLRSHTTSIVAVPMAIPLQLIPSLALETAGSYAIPYFVQGTADVTATSTFGIERDGWEIQQGGSIPRQVVLDTARSAIPLPF